MSIATDLRAEKMAIRFADAQAAQIIDKPLIEVTAKMKSKLTFILTAYNPIAKGITEKIIKTGIKRSNGAKLKIYLSDSSGTMSSLNITFIASAVDTSNPLGPHLLGPERC